MNKPPKNTPPNDGPDPQEMMAIINRLKAEGRMPSLEEMIAVMKKHAPRKPAKSSPPDHRA